jgi:hypothetical protein
LIKGASLQALQNSAYRENEKKKMKKKKRKKKTRKKKKEIKIEASSARIRNSIRIKKECAKQIARAIGNWPTREYPE